MTNLSDKDFFKAIKKEGREHSDNINESFPYFCLKVFWDDLSNDNIIEALYGLTTDDESVDAFFIDEPNKEINILQFKSCDSEKHTKALKKEWLSYLNDVPNKLRDHNFIDNHRNERIREIAKDYILCDKKGFKTKLHFFHLGKANQNALEHYKEITYYGLDEIKDEYQEYLSKLDRTEPPSIDIQLKFGLLQPDVSKAHKTLVSIITGDEIVNLRQQYRYKLFDKNLRFGLGKNKINKIITATAQNEPGVFYFYNNGITITSKGFKYQPTNSKLKIEFPQIINGAQTVNAIYDAYKYKENKNARDFPSEDSETKTKKEFNTIKLLFRVIQDAEKDGKKTSPFEEKVIRFNNSQNSIKETDFYANNPEQIRLQELMSQHGYFYEIKRGDRKFLESGKEEHNLLKKKRQNFSSWAEKVDIEKLASIWMAFDINPSMDRIKKSNIFGYANDKHYEEVFQDIEQTTDEKIKKMILAYHLFDIISEQAKIYGNTIKHGQIISKISQFNKDSPEPEKTFANIHDIVNNSFFFGRVFVKSFESMDSFFKDQEQLIKQAKKYQFFPMGKYLTLAIFRLILDECEYNKALIDDLHLFKNKIFIEQYIVKPWLKTILEDLIEPAYSKSTEDGLSMRAFYDRTGTWDNIKNSFKSLKYDKDKEYNEIFPLNFNRQ